MSDSVNKEMLQILEKIANELEAAKQRDNTLLRKVESI
jgi:hypothetical protein